MTIRFNFAKHFWAFFPLFVTLFACRVSIIRNFGKMTIACYVCAALRVTKWMDFFGIV